MASQERFKKLYQWMLEKGELKQLFPNATGDWEKDKKQFIRRQTEIEELANITNVYLDDEE